MRKTIKMKIARGFLLFLFTFFSVGVQGQLDSNSHRVDIKPVRGIEWTENGVMPVYTLQIATGLVNLPSDLTLTLTMNLQIPDGSGGTTSSYSYTGGSGYNFPSTYLESILNSIMSSYGILWGIGDSTSDTVFVRSSGGGGGFVTEPCGISCPVGFNLINCKCIKDPCAEAKKNDTRSSNAIILNQNNQIRTLSTNKEFGAEQNLTIFPPGAVPIFKDILVRTNPVNSANIQDIKSFTAIFTWNATQGYTIGVSHGHPDGRGPSFADLILPATFLNALKSLNGSPAAIDYFKANFTLTTVTANEIITISVTDWDALETLRAEFDLDKDMARIKYGDIAQRYLEANYKNMSLTTAILNEATTYAAIKIAGHAVSISKLENGTLKFVPLKIDGDICLKKNPCNN